MKLRAWLSGVFLSITIAAAGAQDSKAPVESQHVAGPRGIEGWTLRSTLPDQPVGTFAFTLVLARNGKVMRRIKGEPIIWRWIFWDQGRKVAVETGPMHFVMACHLVDVVSGRLLKNVDCYHHLPPDTPAWVDALEKSDARQ